MEQVELMVVRSNSWPEAHNIASVMWWILIEPEYHLDS